MLNSFVASKPTEKEAQDILAPGGKFIFCTDKAPLTFTDVNLETYCAVTEFVRDYGVYSNAGETSGLEFNKADYIVNSSASRKLESKYLTSWEQHKAQHPQTSDFGIQKLQGIEDDLFRYLFQLLI